MRYGLVLGTLMTGLLLAGCNTQPEEPDATTVDITEAIPFDEADVADGSVPVDSSTPGDAPATMESGSNVDGGQAPDPSRSKLQPAD